MITEDNKGIKYIKDEDFRKMTKKERLAIQESFFTGEEEIKRLILIPSNKKMNGYNTGVFLAYSEGKGWWRPMTYDCWGIVTDIESPAKPRYKILRGDFEYGGVNIFSFMDEYHKAFISYGGQVIIRKMNNE